jgi:hypothetical protein
MFHYSDCYKGIQYFYIVIRATNGSVAIQGGRCEGIACGNRKSSSVLLKTGLRFFTSPNDILINAFLLLCREAGISPCLSRLKVHMRFA